MTIASSRSPRTACPGMTPPPAQGQTHCAGWRGRVVKGAQHPGGAESWKLLQPEPDPKLHFVGGRPGVPPLSVGPRAHEGNLVHGACYPARARRTGGPWETSRGLSISKPEPWEPAGQGGTCQGVSWAPRDFPYRLPGLHLPVVTGSSHLAPETHVRPGRIHRSCRPGPGCQQMRSLGTCQFQPEWPGWLRASPTCGP